MKKLWKNKESEIAKYYNNWSRSAYVQTNVNIYDAQKIAKLSKVKWAITASACANQFIARSIPTYSFIR